MDMPVPVLTLRTESLRSLHFPEMDQRKNDVQNAAADTCKWLLDHEKYSNWLAQPQALLWIVGKPGAGKSTLVKRALQERGHRNDVLASFFFFGQGCKLQKSSFGLFRSLLYKFLDQIPEMLSEFTSIYQKKQATQQKLGSDCEWQESELQDFLKDWIPRALMNRPIRVYVDALDECAPDDAKRLIAYFDELIEGLSSTRVGFKICFSCRHYPVLAPKGALRINVESGNNQDIATYVRHGLMKHGFPDTEPAQKLEQDIIRKASNVFQWAVLVIQIVIELEKNGASIRKIRQEIEKVPGDLKALYEHILSKIQDQKRAYQLMQWVCFADRPLSPKELRFAMAVDITNDFTSLEECQSSVDFAETDEQMEKQVNSLSAGLAETVEYDGRRIVRFMHQSVNDYLADGGLQKLDTSFFHDLMPNLKDSLSDKVAGLAHFRISRSCIKYINMKEFLSKIRGLSSLEAREFRLEKRKLMFDFPFLIYAAEWVSHARIVDTLRIPQDDLVRFFRWQPEDVAEFWGRYYDPAERNGKLVNGRRAKVTLLSIASEYGLLSVVEAIVEADENFDFDSRDCWGQTPLSLAARSGYEAIVRLLIGREDVEINSKDNSGRTPLLYAAQSGHEAVVRLLIGREDVEINLKDNLGRTPLSYAARSGHEAVVRLLIGREDVEINSKDNFEQTPLLHAARAGHEAVVRLLIGREDIEINSKDNLGQTPLSYAALSRHEAVVRLLIGREDVEINSKDRWGQTPLSHAAQSGHKAVVRLLIGREDIKINLKDNLGRTPLSYAAHSGHEAVVRLLIGREDVEINLRNRSGRTPLWYAAKDGHAAMVQILINRADVEIDSKDNDGSTPLSIADYYGHQNVVELLEREISQRQKLLEG